jgi:hypothetical protein
LKNFRGDLLPNKFNTYLQNYLSRFLYRPPILFHSLFEERLFFERISLRIPDQIRQAFARKLNPFNLCPHTIVYWFLIPPYSAIGLSILGLHRVAVFWRQQIEPNETVYVMYRILEFKIPFPLMLFTMFSLFGLVITGTSYGIYEELYALFTSKQPIIDAEAENKQGISNLLDPFNLTPKMSIYFPVYDDHTSLGFLDITFRHAELSLKQSLEPNETIFSLIRFLDLYAPFPIMIGLIMLSIGLFLTGIIYENRQELQLSTD